MTNQKMPDEISLFRCEGEGDIKWSEDRTDALATYVNEDLYTAVCAERDALRALCEGVAAALENAKYRLEGAGMLGWMTDPVAYQLAAYENHKQHPTGAKEE